MRRRRRDAAQVARSVAAAAIIAATVSCSTTAAEPDRVDRNAAAIGTTTPTTGVTSPTPQTIVSLGDSYISGTAGRWAGNSNGFSNVPRDLASFARSDTGDDAYDNLGQPTIDFCFRSRSAEIHLGSPWQSVNLACSGAETTTLQRDRMGLYKPGLDDDGQLALLRATAADASVRLVVVSIGANNFRFGPIIEACASAFLTSSSAFPSLCSEDRTVRGYVDDAAVTRVRDDIAAALVRVVSTMRDIGYTDATWHLVVQNYPTPLPPAARLRHSQFGYGRQVEGGCPFYDADVDWLQTVMARFNSTVAEAVADARAATGRPIAELDLSRLFDGRRLCEQGTKHVEETPDENTQRRYAERIAQIHLSSSLPGSPYDITEGVHPNHYGQLAFRACLRRAFGDGAAVSGSCTAPSDWGAVDARGEPLVVFTPT
jgi:hypothetical protein